MSIELDMDDIEIELDDMELDNLDFDESLLNEALAEEEQETEDKPSSAPSADDGLFASGEAQATASFLIDGLEMLAQTFGHREYVITNDKKSMFISSYGRLLEKHQGKAPALLMNWKEEILALIITAIVLGSVSHGVKSLKARDAQKEETQRGEESQ